jgi:uncharacterized protein
MTRIAIAGSTGLVGSALCARLRSRGIAIRPIARRAGGRPDEVVWDPASGAPPPRLLEDCDAVVNLAGEPVSKRWTRSVRRRILESRVAATTTLAQACVDADVPVLVNASATGWYGDRGDEILDEHSPCGGGFLADVCVAWEHALRQARVGGVRTVSCRFGMVLAKTGGALPRMTPAFKAGLGGPLGSGRQWMPWIHLADAVSTLEHALVRSDLEGPILATAPQAVRQEEFARQLARGMGRQARFRVPAWVLRLALGDMADELLLASQRCHPARLLETRQAWAFPDLPGALADLLG